MNSKHDRTAVHRLKDMDGHSVCVSYLLKNRLVFGPYGPEKEICFLNEKAMFKRKRMSIVMVPYQIPLLNDCHLVESLPFHCTLPLTGLDL